jgi:hypothetical protein
MKKCNLFLMSAVALFLCTGYLHAQVFMVVKGETSTPYNDLEDAVAAAEAGSTVYIPTLEHVIKANPLIEGSARPATLLINKKLTLIGAGSHEGVLHSTVLRGNVTLTAEASGTRLEGFTITENLYFDNVSDFIFNRGQVNGTIFLSGKGGANIFRECQLSYIQSTVSLYGSTGLPDASIFIEIMVQNSIITSFTNGLKKAIFTNNVFTNNGGNIFSNVHQSIITNNIFTINGVLETNFSGSSMNNYTYNLVVGSFGASAPDNYNVVENNIENVSLANIFEDQIKYQLKAGSPGKNAGYDGTDMGIYGGLSPAKDKRIPGNPAVTEFTVAGMSAGDGSLPVKVKVEAQEK